MLLNEFQMKYIPLRSEPVKMVNNNAIYGYAKREQDELRKTLEYLR
jgi:hypothetical protein